MGEEIKANYKMTQLELYSVTRTMCASAKEDIAKLHDLSDRYDIAYIDGILAAVDAAEDLPDEDEREDTHETEKVELEALNEICLSNFRKLERYIEKAYEKNLWKIKNDAAGGTKYRKAQNKNWEYTVGMNKDMNDFVTDATTQAKLELNNNMPHAFVAKVGTDKDKFKLKYESFKTAKQTSDKTQAKLVANNGVYAMLTELSKDGQVALEDNEGKQRKYIIQNVKDLVSPPGSASLRVEVQNSVFEPVPGAVITIQIDGRAAISAVVATDEERGNRAIANIAGIDPGVYDWSVFAREGDRTPLAIGRKEVNKGTDARLKITLPAAPTP